MTGGGQGRSSASAAPRTAPMSSAQSGRPISLRVVSPNVSHAEVEKPVLITQKPTESDPACTSHRINSRQGRRWKPGGPPAPGIHSLSPFPVSVWILMCAASWDLSRAEHHGIRSLLGACGIPNQGVSPRVISHPPPHKCPRHGPASPGV